MAWYKEWFGAEYLELYSHRDQGEAEAHVDFVVEVFSELQPRAVLDLASGAGRHTQALRRRKIRALGVDLSLTSLERATPPTQRSGRHVLPAFLRRGLRLGAQLLHILRLLRERARKHPGLHEIHRVPDTGGAVSSSICSTATTSWPTSCRRSINSGKATKWRSSAGSMSAPSASTSGYGSTAPNRKVQTFLESVRAYTRQEVEEASGPGRSDRWTDSLAIFRENHSAVTANDSFSSDTNPADLEELDLLATGRFPPLVEAFLREETWICWHRSSFSAPKINPMGDCEATAPDRQELGRGAGGGQWPIRPPGGPKARPQLADPSTRVVITGQQPGLFGGPLYTLSKAVAAQLWVERLRAAGERAMALFWMATEDHDFRESSQATFFTDRGRHDSRSG